jgi:glutaredoxin-related protein
LAARKGLLSEKLWKEKERRQDIMKIHYFQRYHEKENVATANTMLLLSRLYSYSSEKFFRFLKSEFFSDSFEPEIVFNLQEKSIESIPDATITQESFKIVVETKLSDWFYSDQLLRHLKSFSDEKYKVMITLAPELMDSEKKKEFEIQLKDFNTSQTYPVMHINTTFEGVVNAIQDVVDDKDYEMQEVLDDYLNYCYRDRLIIVSDSWKRMRVQLAGKTFDFNVKENLYYDNIDRGFSAHDYLGLYKEKSVRAIGKINTIITGVVTNAGIEYKAELGYLTDERKQQINRAIEDGKNYGYVLDAIRYFFVDKFYEADFKKITPKAPRGSRVFDLTQILDTEQLPNLEEFAKNLTSKTWG